MVSLLKKKKKPSKKEEVKEDAFLKYLLKFKKRTKLYSDDVLKAYKELS